MSTDPAVTRLIEAAALPYLVLGNGAWEFARHKLRYDPIYLDLLRSGELPRRGSIVDLGCGQGLALALLAAARDQCRSGEWPTSWPPSPADIDLLGIELRPRAARRAREALGPRAIVEEGDLAGFHPPRADAFLLVDVLHLMPAAAQEQLVAMCAAALEADGVLVLREVDAASGWRFHVVRFGNRIVAALRGRILRRFHFRSAEAWCSLLEQSGLVVTRRTTPGRRPFGNFAVYARRGAPANPCP